MGQAAALSGLIGLTGPLAIVLKPPPVTWLGLISANIGYFIYAPFLRSLRHPLLLTFHCRSPLPMAAVGNRMEQAQLWEFPLHQVGPGDNTFCSSCSERSGSCFCGIFTVGRCCPRPIAQART